MDVITRLSRTGLQTIAKIFPELLLSKIAVTAAVSVEFYTNLYVVHYSTVAIAENFGGELNQIWQFPTNLPKFYPPIACNI